MQRMGFLVSTSCLPVFAQFVVYFMLLLNSLCIAETRNSFNGSIPAIFVFGDSTVDSGNNNYIKTLARSNFQPYGKDFPDGIPTGRFSNGRLYTDILASYMGIKDYVPPYLDPTLSLDGLKTGVCFASAGTGFDPLTAQIIGGVIPMEKQLTYFQEYVLRMETYIGKKRTTSLISKSMFIISAGTNDFILNYYLLPIRRKTYTVSAYQEFVSQLSQQFIKGLLKLGARKIVLVGLPPLGCLPAVITLKSNNTLAPRRCIEQLSSVARDYNRLLQDKLATTVRSTKARIVYFDIYKPIDDLIKKPQQFGFEIVDRGCCGSGLLEFSILCNRLSPVCSDDSKYLFWDAAHPCEAAFYIIFKNTRHFLNHF